MATNSGRALQRMMVAGGLVVAGGFLLLMGRVAKSTSDALQGQAPTSEAVAPAPASATPPKAATPSGVIHIQEGDPLPPATPLGPGRSAPAAAQPSPTDMSRDELMHEVAVLRARVALMEAQQAAARAALRDAAGPGGH